MSETKNLKIRRFSVMPLFTGLIRLYQLCISPLLGPSCRFYPTCSAYAILAIKQFGVVKGCYLAAYRIGRCHPLCKGGVDFPPEEFTWRPVNQGKHDCSAERQEHVQA